MSIFFHRKAGLGECLGHSFKQILCVVPTTAVCSILVWAMQWVYIVLPGQSYLSWVGVYRLCLLLLIILVSLFALKRVACALMYRYEPLSVTAKSVLRKVPGVLLVMLAILLVCTYVTMGSYRMMMYLSATLHPKGNEAAVLSFLFPIPALLLLSMTYLLLPRYALLEKPFWRTCVDTLLVSYRHLPRVFVALCITIFYFYLYAAVLFDVVSRGYLGQLTTVIALSFPYAIIGFPWVLLFNLHIVRDLNYRRAHFVDVMGGEP